MLESPIKLMDIITDPSINDLIDPIFDTINPETGPIIDALIVSGSRIRAVSTASSHKLAGKSVLASIGIVYNTL